MSPEEARVTAAARSNVDDVVLVGVVSVLPSVLDDDDESAEGAGANPSFGMIVCMMAAEVVL